MLAADPLAPRITPAFLEYAQARDFHNDPARVRHAQDKGAWNARSPAFATIASPASS